MYKHFTSVNELRDFLGPKSFLPHDAMLANSITSKNDKMKFTRIFAVENSASLAGGKRRYRRR